MQIALLALLAGCLGAAVAGGSPAAGVGAVVAAVLLTAVDLRPSLTHEHEASQDISLPEPDVRQARPASQDPKDVASGHEAPSPTASHELAPQETQPAHDAVEALSPEATDQQPETDAAPNPAKKVPRKPKRAPSRLDFSALSHALTSSNDPIAELKRFVGDIRTREAEQTGPKHPCELERYAARMLEEAGLFASDVALPALTVTRPRASRMVYLRCDDEQLPYLAKLRIIRLEAALNAIRFASASLPATASMEDAYRLNQGLARSVVAQAAAIDEPLDLSEVGEWPEGEWTVRYGISQAIETLQLPYRLAARYRTNVADGNVAIEVELTPAEVFPASQLVDDLGIVPTTGDMRQRAAADYALRLALLLAASAFRCSEQVRHVWVAGIMQTATHRSCYYSVDFDRWRFARIDLQDLGDLAETYRSFAPMLRYEDGWLRPVKQTFHLEEERFCPARRYLPVSLSSRRLTGHVAESLGTDHVSGLSIEESDGRSVVATAIMMRLAPEGTTDATQKNVRTVMELAGDDPDPTVRTAAERVMRGLVDGTLEADAFALGEEFVRGDALTRANDRAKQLLMQQKPAEAHQAVAPLIAAIDEAGTYADTPAIVYRYYNSYVERALHNRRLASMGTHPTVMLVPDAYYEAHLLVSITFLMAGRHEEALEHALRLVELAPFDARARLHAVKCLEVLERDDEAIEQLNELLGFAYEPQGLGLAYYRMAFFQWKLGNVVAARACYQCAMRFLPEAVPMMAMELSVLYLQNPDALESETTDQQIEDALTAQGIAIAPTEQTSEVFYDCARASLDAEIFPVARTFARIMARFASDDVITGVLRSLEDEPDRL